MSSTALFLGLLFAGTAQGDELARSPGDRWTGFRGIGTGWTEAADLPTAWTEPAWTAALPGEGQSSPVVLGDLVFVTSVEGAEKELAFITCLRLADGLPLWIRSFPASTRIASSNTVSKGAPTPAVDADRVYALFESGDLVCLDHGGRLLWSLDAFARFGPFVGKHGLGSSPVLAGSSVVLLLEHEGPSHLIGVDAETGEPRWVVEREPRVSWSTPVVVPSGDEVIVSSDGVAEGFAVADGALRWRVAGIEGNTVPSPTVRGARVVIGLEGRRPERRPAPDQYRGGGGAPALVRREALALRLRVAAGPR